MSQSSSEMSSFLAELAGEATQKLEAKRALQQDRQAMMQSVNASLERTFQFLNLFIKHLNALEPEIPRVYALDGKTQFSGLKWKSGMVEFRKQNLADNALLDHVYFQARLIASNPVTLTRRWEQFGEIKKELDAFGLKATEDVDELWRNRLQKAAFQTGLAPEFLIRLRFQGNYSDGCVELECNNLDGFGVLKGKLKPELLQAGLFDEFGRFLMGRVAALPQELRLERDLARVL
ncbi:MAG TPA: hypothetical protein VK149_11310 [Sideroxyarcus sp.]|nr:hypothetical protein [Sideroxyarcus sp.]